MLLLNYCNKKNKNMKDIEYRRNINIDIDIYIWSIIFMCLRSLKFLIWH